MYVLTTINYFITYYRKKREHERHSSSEKVSKKGLFKNVVENVVLLIFTMLLFLYSFDLYSEQT